MITDETLRKIIELHKPLECEWQTEATKLQIMNAIRGYNGNVDIHYGDGDKAGEIEDNMGIGTDAADVAQYLVEAYNNAYEMAKELIKLREAKMMEVTGMEFLNEWNLF